MNENCGSINDYENPDKEEETDPDDPRNLYSKTIEEEEDSMLYY